MNNKSTNNLLNAILPVAAAIIYVLIGYFFKGNGWAVGWLVFLLIPVISSGVTAHKTKNPSSFVYPLLVTTLFLAIGLLFHVWHPTWLLFITIPAYYSICDYIKQKRMQKLLENGDANSDMPSPPPMPQAGEVPPYAQYPQYPPYPQPYAPQKKSNTLMIVISVILSITIVAVVGLFGLFSLIKNSSGNFSSQFNGIFNDDDYTELSDNAEFDIDGITGLEIDWINGNVTVEYYDGDKIFIEENKKLDKNLMCYKIDDGVLKISEYKDNKIIGNNATKDLFVRIPKDFKTNDIEIDVVSATVSAIGIKSTYFELNTVSGNAHLVFAETPRKIETDSVSGDIRIELPEDIAGYSLTRDTISGEFSSKSFNNASSFGDGSVIIKSESVSGSLTIEKTGPING